jgi:hypothetical protein
LFTLNVHRLAVLALVWVLAGCASLASPRTITVSEVELARLIEKQFPLDSRLLDVLDVSVGSPRLSLMPGHNRLATELDLLTGERMFGRAYKGQIALDYGLRYDEQSQAIRLTGVRVNRLQLDSGSDSMPATLNRLGGLLAEQMLKDLPIYRFKPEDFDAMNGMGYQPGTVAVTAKGVEITLLPVTR